MEEHKFEVFTESFEDIPTRIECNGQKLTYKEVANLLNKLLSENKQLIQHRKDCIDKAKWFNNEIDSLFEKNKELKQTNQKIYELISDYVNTHHSISTMRLLKKIKKELKSE